MRQRESFASTNGTLMFPNYRLLVIWFATVGFISRQSSLYFYSLPFRDAPKLQDEWFSDPDAVRTRVGLVEENPETRRKESVCNICFDTFPLEEMAAARCKHYFCKTCWQGYVHSAVESGPSCLDLRCPEPSCKAVAPTALVVECCDESHAKKYREFSLRSFVDDNKRFAWCTAPGCTNAVEALVEAPREPLDIHCSCGNAFCFTCKEEAHRPVDCDTVRRWMVKNSAESENMTWILANTKPCPKCTRPIEKNQGCMHMTCSQCRHEFCWLCSGPWSEHGERTGGYYNCNTYKKKEEAGTIDEAEEQRQHARASLERYMHYWQRWAEHDKARRTAIKQMDQWESELLETLSERTSTPVSQLRFVLDAWKEVVSCRRVLKWTYAVGYYSFDEPERGANQADKDLLNAHKEFFEFTQQEAENALERMNHKVEKQLQAFIREDGNAPIDPTVWATFREELIGLTDVTRIQFAKLVDFLEKGLDEGLAEFRGATNPWASSSGQEPNEEEEEENANAASGSGGAGPSRRPAAQPLSPPGEQGGGGGAAARRSTRLSKKQRGSGDDEAGGSEGKVWMCETCTFVNEFGSKRCEMCQLAKKKT